MHSIDWTQLNQQKKRGDLFTALEPVSASERLRLLTTYIEQQVTFIQRSQGAMRPRGVERSFVAIGFDSLMSVDLLYFLERDLARELNPVVLEQETIDDLALHILRELWREH